MIQLNTHRLTGLYPWPFSYIVHPYRSVVPFASLIPLRHAAGCSFCEALRPFYNLLNPSRVVGYYRSSVFSKNLSENLFSRSAVFHYFARSCISEKFSRRPRGRTFICSGGRTFKRHAADSLPLLFGSRFDYFDNSVFIFSDTR